MLPDIEIPDDERQLILQAASELLKKGIYEPPVANLVEQVRIVSKTLGSDYAMALLFAWFLQHPNHGPFIRDFFSHDHLPLDVDSVSSLSKPELVLVVPGAFFREHKTTGADGEPIVKELQRLEVRVERVPIQSVGTLEQNSRILRERLHKTPAQRIMIVSLSKGAADIKWALRDDPACFQQVAMWISVGGTLSGTPIVNWVQDRLPIDWLNRLCFFLRGRDYRFFRELARRVGGALDFELNLPSHVHAVHMIGFPLRRHAVSRYAKKFYQRFAKVGPNDAVLMHEDLIGLPGKVLPIWGADHYFSPRWEFRLLVHGMLRYWHSQLNPGTIAAGEQQSTLLNT